MCSHMNVLHYGGTLFHVSKVTDTKTQLSAPSCLTCLVCISRLSHPSIPDLLVTAPNLPKMQLLLECRSLAPLTRRFRCARVGSSFAHARLMVDTLFFEEAYGRVRASVSSLICFASRCLYWRDGGEVEVIVDSGRWTYVQLLFQRRVWWHRNLRHRPPCQ